MVIFGKRDRSFASDLRVRVADRDALEGDPASTKSFQEDRSDASPADEADRPSLHDDSPFPPVTSYRDDPPRIVKVHV